MGNEHGEWIMHGVSEDSPDRIRTPEELISYVDEVGFLPLFANGIKGFSVEEHTVSKYWWSDDLENDPWYWRTILSRSKRVAYGKFFDKKAGYISLEWFPTLANYRRNGYDFDARWDDELANFRSKRIMDLFSDGSEKFSYEIKSGAGFGSGEKNFEGTLTSLQMQTYLTVRDFRQRNNRQGVPYGWAIAVYTMPETVWGYDTVSRDYHDDPEISKEKIVTHIRKLYPDADEKKIISLIK